MHTLAHTHHTSHTASLMPSPTIDAALCFSSYFLCHSQSNSRTQEHGSDSGDHEHKCAHRYSALGKLARRVPSRFRNDFDLLERMFRASLVPDERVRSHVRDALAMMKGAFAAPDDVCGARVVRLLREFVTRPESSSRLLAVQYANALFSTDHLPSRYACSARHNGDLMTICPHSHRLIDYIQPFFNYSNQLKLFLRPSSCQHTNIPHAYTPLPPFQVCLPAWRR